MLLFITPWSDVLLFISSQVSGPVTCTSFHPVHLLLASTLLRLSLSLHTTLHHDYNTCKSPKTSEKLTEALSVSQEGLAVMETTHLADPCLLSSLLTHKGTWTAVHFNVHVHIIISTSPVSLLLRSPTAERSEVTNELLVAIQSITNNGIDYKLVYTTATCHFNHCSEI